MVPVYPWLANPVGVKLNSMVILPLAFPLVRRDFDMVELSYTIAELQTVLYLSCIYVI